MYSEFLISSPGTAPPLPSRNPGLVLGSSFPHRLPVQTVRARAPLSPLPLLTSRALVVLSRVPTSSPLPERSFQHGGQTLLLHRFPSRSTAKAESAPPLQGSHGLTHAASALLSLSTFTGKHREALLFPEHSKDNSKVRKLCLWSFVFAVPSA